MAIHKNYMPVIKKAAKAIGLRANASGTAMVNGSKELKISPSGTGRFKNTTYTDPRNLLKAIRSSSPKTGKK